MPIIFRYNHKNEVMNMIADRIKELRLKNGIKQTELAKILGLSRSAINAWEMGVSVPSTQYLIDLSKLFRVSTDHLLGREKKEMETIFIAIPLRP